MRELTTQEHIDIGQALNMANERYVAGKYDINRLFKDELGSCETEEAKLAFKNKVCDSYKNIMYRLVRKEILPTMRFIKKEEKK